MKCITHASTKLLKQQATLTKFILKVQGYMHMVYIYIYMAIWNVFDPRSFLPGKLLIKTGYVVYRLSGGLGQLCGDIKR